MKEHCKKFLLLTATILLVLTPLSSSANSCVILLHGLARTADSMQKVSDALSQAGFVTENIDYPSRSATIEVLAESAITQGLKRCAAHKATGVNFVTHSLGGILVRQYLSNHSIDNLERVVMLAPPNQGSELIDDIENIPGVQWFNGPSLEQLSAEPGGFPKSLGRVNFDVGIIAGTRTFNPILSQFLPNPDDGKVSVEGAKVEGMCGFLTVPESHPFIMKNDLVIRQVIHYLNEGIFDHVDAEHYNCEAGNG